MKKTDQRIAIAEACGWDKESALRGFKTATREIDGRTYQQISEQLPDYLNDLNAMRKAVMTLDDKQLERFHDRLTAGVIGWASYHKDWIVYRATAAQWAQAFLMTKGLWKD